MWTELLGKLASVKLSLTQYLILAVVGIISAMASVLKFKEYQLHKAKTELLESHFENEKVLQQSAIENSEKRVKTSKENYEESLAKLNALR